MSNQSHEFSVELIEGLKKLKLTGMLETLSSRVDESLTNKLSYLDFFGMLVQDEILRREHNRFNSSIKKSNINPNKTIEQFDFGFNPKINASEIKELLTFNFTYKKSSVLLMGPSGTGKSHLAQAIGFKAIQKGIDVLFITHDKLQQDLQRAKATGCFTNKVRKYARIPLLIIDDFGLKPFKSEQDEDFHEIIAERYEVFSTIITSNLAFREWQKIFLNKLLGSATIDRVRHRAKEIILDGDSYRTKQK